MVNEYIAGSERRFAVTVYERADVAQSVEHLIGNEEVRRFKSARQLQQVSARGRPGRRVYVQ